MEKHFPTNREYYYSLSFHLLPQDQFPPKRKAILFKTKKEKLMLFIKSVINKRSISMVARNMFVSQVVSSQDPRLSHLWTPLYLLYLLRSGWANR